MAPDLVSSGLRTGRAHPTRRDVFAFAALGLAAGAARSAAAAATPAGQLTWGVHISLAPTWFDPAETSGIITPYMVLYGYRGGCRRSGRHRCLDRANFSAARNQEDDGL